MFRQLMVLSALLGVVVLSGCPVGGGGGDDDDDVEDTIILTIENRTGAQLWNFQYRECGAALGDGTEVIDQSEFVANGSDVSSVELDPGCYDIYVQDEFACWAENSTDGNIAGGNEFTWTVVEANLTCD